MADIKYACTAAQMPLTDGVFTVTIASLGWTPKAVIAHITNATGTANTATAILGVGVCVKDGNLTGNEFAFVTHDRHGRANSVCKNDVTPGATIYALNQTGANPDFVATGAGNGSGSNPGPIADGWRFNATDVTGGKAYYVVFEFFGGEDLKVNCDLFQLNNGLNNTTTISLDGTSGDGSFKSDLLLTFASNRTTTDAINNNSLQCLGAVDFVNSKQKSIAIAGDHSNTTATNHTRHESDAGLHSVSVAGVLNWSVEFSSPTSTGFDATERDSAVGNKYMGYLAMNVAGSPIWVDSIDSPVSNSVDWVVDGPGFKPICARVIQSGITAGVDSTENDTQAYSHGTSVYDGTREHTASIHSEDGVGTTDTESTVKDNFLWCRAGSGPALIANGNFASGDGFTPQGWTMKAAGISTANATARKWIGIAIGAGKWTPSQRDRRTFKNAILVS